MRRKERDLPIREAAVTLTMIKEVPGPQIILHRYSPNKAATTDSAAGLEKMEK